MRGDTARKRAEAPAAALEQHLAVWREELEPDAKGRPKHLPECLEEIARRIELHEQWHARHPGACVRCHGRGEQVWESPFEPPEADACSCVHAKVCPGCGVKHRKGWAEREQPCRACGWNGWYGGPYVFKDDPPPERVEYCECFIEMWTAEHGEPGVVLTIGEKSS